MIKFSPYKPIEFPKKYLIYTHKSYSCYTSKAFDVKTGENVGEMQTYIPLSKYSLYIAKLISYKRNQGVGTTLINFAKNLSKKFSVSGNMHLLASSKYDKVNPPFLFYRKMGFEPMDCPEYVVDHLDKCIRENKQVNTDILDEDIFMIYNKNKNSSCGK